MSDLNMKVVQKSRIEKGMSYWKPRGYTDKRYVSSTPHISEEMDIFIDIFEEMIR